ncbi:multiple sugar transport system permease protein [Arboricoccus pini]|uniref:Multiple sugar transport system permease protein n=1 Tax=Arboricoccus pini TaxID=1963835 RepID=A0A212RYZ2_9PROT|nr:sugar ABC transporter permease [Arboricoccus pini]SNB77947.1 multiple sugar transport system permease protein [Arboricoccus pini]
MASEPGLVRPAAPLDRQARTRRTRELSDGHFALLIGLPVIAFLIAVVGYPLIYSIWMSLHKIVFFGGYRATFAGLDNYASVLHDEQFWWSTWVTIRFTIESVLLTMVLGLLIALLLNRRLMLGGLIRTLIFLPWCVSLYGAGLMFAYLARSQTGLGTAILGLLGIDATTDFLSGSSIIEVLAIGNAWTMAPLVAMFILANLKTIPTRLYDLAAIDRLSAFETFRYVTLPPIRFSLFVFTSITTVLSMKLFDFIFVLSGGGPGTASATLTYQVYKRSFKELNLGLGSAMSFYLLFLIIGSTLLLFLLWGRKEKPL